MLKLALSLVINMFLLTYVITSQSENVHSTAGHEIEINSLTHKLYDNHQGRLLQAYHNISIVFDTLTISQVHREKADYLLNDILPAAKNIITAMLQMPRRDHNLTTDKTKLLCSNNIHIPENYRTTGIDADLVIFVFIEQHRSIAKAEACLLDEATYRPIIGVITFNPERFSSTQNEAIRERDLMATLHELTHILGFDSRLYPKFMDVSTGKPRVNHTSQIISNGHRTIILDLPPLTARVRSYFNCSTAPGAYLENEGTGGNRASHFERRIFYNEYMTAGEITDVRISEFSLALLEGTGWYQVNYAMVDPMTWGRNKGCSFLSGPCVERSTGKPNFDEFCPVLSARSCSWTKRTVEYCGTRNTRQRSILYVSDAVNWWNNYTYVDDAFSDNCPTYNSADFMDCENTDLIHFKTLEEEQLGYGSKCFVGSLQRTPQTTTTASGYCFKSHCALDSDGDHYIQLFLGSQTVMCSSEGPIQLDNYIGELQCPDPNSFCAQVTTEGFCRRGCSARGRCVDRVCECEEGWGSYDCSKRVHVKGCARCSNSSSDVIRGIICYGDECIVQEVETSNITVSNGICSSRGHYVNSTCQCEDGWTGSNCTQLNYVSGCLRCRGSVDNLLTTCYGYDCVATELPAVQNATLLLNEELSFICTKRGRYTNGTCQCEDGWTSSDCSAQIRISGCARCRNNTESSLTICYGNSCVAAETTVVSLLSPTSGTSSIILVSLAFVAVMATWTLGLALKKLIQTRRHIEWRPIVQQEIINIEFEDFYARNTNDESSA